MATRSVYDYVPHHRTKEKLEHGTPPVKVSDQLPHDGAAARFNAWFAVKVTNGIGTMWCADAFAALALVSLPSAVSSHSPVVLVSWISQTFLQLVLLSVIIVGQYVLAAAADKRAEATYNDADAVLHEVVKLQEHLLAQDANPPAADQRRCPRRPGVAPKVLPGLSDQSSVLCEVVGDSSDRGGAPAAEHVGEDRAALVL